MDLNRDERIENFSLTELATALKQLKAGKAADANNISAEMLKSGGLKLRDVILKCFNDIIRPDGDTPREWHKTLIKVLHKNEDMRLPQNYRPIATIPLLYKLFSTMVYNRLNLFWTQSKAWIKRDFEDTGAQWITCSQLY